MRDRPIGTAPNYTIPALVMLGVNLFWMLGVIWAVWGLVPVLVLAMVLNHLITRLGAARGAPDDQA